MILSDGEIIEAIKNGEINISPFDEKCLTPNGYDLHIGGIEEDNFMYKWTSDFHWIKPLKSFRVVSLETITCDALHVAFLHLKTRYSRSGIQATFGKIDAGFNGTLSFGLFNGSNLDFQIKKCDKIVQIHFETLGKPAQQLYAQRSGNYQNQKEKVMK